MSSILDTLAPQINRLVLERLFDHFFIVHDQKGKILESFGMPYLAPHPLYNEIIKSSTLAPYFDLSELAHGDKDFILIPGKSTGIHKLYQHNVVSSRSLYRLIAQPLDNNLFLSRIRVHGIAPESQLNISLSFFFTDLHGETLLGFDKNMTSLFSDTPKGNLENYLHQPLSDFLSVTPMEFQKKHLARFTMEEGERFRLIREIRSADADYSSRLITAAGAVVAQDGDTTTIEASAENPVFLRFPDEINTADEDIIFTVTFKRVSGAPPYLTLGRRTEGETEPDWSGYMLGFSAADNRTVLKRMGYIVTDCGSDYTPGEMEIFSLCKIGKSLFFYSGNRCLLGYFDEEFLFGPDTQAAFVVRSGSTCLIHSMRLKSRPFDTRMKQALPSHYITSFVSRPDHYCLLSRFYNVDLNHFRFAGYQPVDMTALQSEIISLEKKQGYLEHQTAVLDELLRNYQSGEDDFIGTSEPIQRLKKTAHTVASSDATVLIAGPTGSGKEVLARYIHGLSTRKNGAFITVDCATIPKELLESHLFGHEKGAFTGAVARNIGMLERADQGTLFLDEVGNLSLEAQAKLLRFFNDHTVVRVGGGKPIRVNVRCLLAGNRNLQEMVMNGTFRADLYYRINVVSMQLPALIDRASDIQELSHYYLRRFAAMNNKTIRQIEPDALLKLRNHDWPGNVRELKNVLERAVVFAPGGTLTAGDIHFSNDKEEEKPVRKRKPRPAFTLTRTPSERIRALLSKYSGNVTAAARELGVERVSLHLHLKRSGIRAEEYRKGF